MEDFGRIRLFSRGSNLERGRQRSSYPGGKRSFAVQALVDEKLESPDIGPVVVAAELSIDMSNIFAGREIGDIKIDGGDQGRDLMHNREDRQLGTGVARNVAPTFVAIVTWLGRRNSCAEAARREVCGAGSAISNL